MIRESLPLWAFQYLNYIQVPLQKPSYDYLKTICAAHLNRIPFENVSTLMNFKVYHKQKRLQQDEQKFVEHLFQHHTGGTCYVINSSLNQLLNCLGFHSRYAFLGGGHVALLVRLPGGVFTSFLRCQIWQLDRQRSLSLVNNVLSIRNNLGQVEKRILANRSEVREVIDHEFNLPRMPVEKAIDVLEELDVNIFQN